MLNQSEKDLWLALQSHLDNRGWGVQNLSKQWPTYVDRESLPRFLAHYELFKQVIDVPGCIVELGVFRGNSLFTWANLLETFCPFDTSRRVYGFESFEGLPSFSTEDGNLRPSVGKCPESFKGSRTEVEILVELYNRRLSVPGSQRLSIVAGKIEDTLSSFLDSHPGLMVSLLHVDLDLYAAVKHSLGLLFDRVIHHGIICFDDYGSDLWPGETRAVNEFFRERNLALKLRKFAFAQSPSAYFVKD